MFHWPLLIGDIYSGMSLRSESMGFNTDFGSRGSGMCCAHRGGGWEGRDQDEKINRSKSRKKKVQEIQKCIREKVRGGRRRGGKGNGKGRKEDKVEDGGHHKRPAWRHTVCPFLICVRTRSGTLRPWYLMFCLEPQKVGSSQCGLNSRASFLFFFSFFYQQLN